MDISIDKALSDLECLLYGWNYQVSLKIFRTPFVAGATPEEYVKAALGNGTTVGGLQIVTPSELAQEVETSLRYSGDQGHGPKPDALKSSQFDDLVRLVLGYLADECQRCSAVVSFWLKEGHPFYPVFWDFAYLIVTSGNAEVFVGSSSD
jgi:hypothetical protein